VAAAARGPDGAGSGVAGAGLEAGPPRQRARSTSPAIPNQQAAYDVDAIARAATAAFLRGAAARPSAADGAAPSNNAVPGAAAHSNNVSWDRGAGAGAENVILLDGDDWINFDGCGGASGTAFSDTRSFGTPFGTLAPVSEWPTLRRTSRRRSAAEAGLDVDDSGGILGRLLALEAGSQQGRVQPPSLIALHSLPYDAGLMEAVIRRFRRSHNGSHNGRRNRPHATGNLGKECLELKGCGESLGHS
jgi:hypothetical protein